MESNQLVSILGSIQAEEKAVVMEVKDNLMIKVVDSSVALLQRWRTVDGQVYVGSNGKMAIIGFSGNPPSNIDKEANASLTPSPYFFRLPRNETEIKKDASDPNIISNIKNPSHLIDDILNMMTEKTSGVVMLESNERRVATSGGFIGIEKLTTFTAHFRVFRGDYTGHWATTGSRLNINDVRNTVKKADEYASITDEAEIDEGKYRVILSPMVFSNLLQLVGRMASAMSVETGSSIFTKVKPGDKIFSPLFTLHDKPLSDLKPIFFDDEGNTTRDKAIIENGVFRTLLFNTALADRHKSKSTGNAGWVFPAPWNLETAPGDASEDDLLDGDGVLFTNNWYTRLQNSMEGIFSTVGRDAILLIRNGRIAGRSKKRLRLAGRLSDMLRNIQALSKTLYPIKWWEVEVPTRAPFVDISSFTVTKSQ
ncbi:MAG: metallopeptidase TldD-related protein [Thermocladium sp.]